MNAYTVGVQVGDKYVDRSGICRSIDDIVRTLYYLW